ncbi:MAG TPA: AraC family transcriptional regulator [Arenibacter sp.]|nr:AraC family transcriptional regulator [Arenibacter sp.]
MTKMGVLVTKMGIPKKKRFISLLERHRGNDKGFVVYKGSDRPASPKYRELKDINLSGHEFLSERIYYCNCAKSGKAGEAFIIECREDYIQLFMGLKGTLRISDGQGGYFDILPNTVQLVKYAYGEIHITARSHGAVEAFIINIHKSLISPDKAYFQNILPFAQRPRSTALSTFAHNPFSIGYRMRQIVEELAEKKYTGCFLEHYIEIKVLELLILYINEWTHSKELPEQENQSEDERISEQMEQVRDLLLADLSETPGLKSLATAVGTNEYHLKVHFKAYFGKSVMTYLRSHKMELAKKLLLESNRKITDIAESLGYKYATHFSAAFKKHHGKLPKNFR